MSISINLLNDDVLLTIFSYLKTKDLVRISEVCTKWYTLSGSDAVWGHIQFYEKSPTPSPIKQYTIMAIVGEALPLFKKMREISSWPEYEGDLVPSFCSKQQEWQKKIDQLHGYTMYTNKSFSNINSSIQVAELFKLVVATVDLYICCARIGFTSLNEAEAFALKTQHTFHNPAPFLLLEQEYNKEGNALKAAEMHQIAQQYQS